MVNEGEGLGNISNIAREVFAGLDEYISKSQKKYMGSSLQIYPTLEGDTLVNRVILTTPSAQLFVGDLEFKKNQEDIPVLRTVKKRFEGNDYSIDVDKFKTMYDRLFEIIDNIEKHNNIVIDDFGKYFRGLEFPTCINLKFPKTYDTQSSVSQELKMASSRYIKQLS